MAVAALAVGVGLAIWLLLIHPVSDEAYNKGRLWGLAYFPFILALFGAAVWAADHYEPRLGSRGVLAVAGGILPLCLLVLAVVVRPSHRIQDAAAKTFKENVARFRHGPLGEVGILSRHGRYVTVCAVEGPKPRFGNPQHFCLEINLRESPNARVEGGYRLPADAGGEFLPEPRDCFGDPVAC